MTVLCVIGARGGSEGLPDKNIRLIHGLPLIAWSIGHARATPEIDRVVVSTDSESIAKVARKAGADVPFLRPAELAQADVGKFQVWQHALAACEGHYRDRYEIFVDLDCTNPLRDTSDISAMIAQFRKGRSRGVNAIFTMCTARKNPYFNLVEPDGDGAMRVSKRLSERVVTRQATPPVFEHVASTYVIDPNYLRGSNHLFDGHAEGYDIGREKSFDIDSPLDFEIVNFLLSRKLAGISS